MSIRYKSKFLIGTFVVGMILLWLSAVAIAKGPESAILTGPGLEEPIDLMTETTSTEDLVRLMEQSGMWYASGDLPTRLEEPPQELGTAYTLTWVNLGPPNKSVEERTIYQYIYLDDEDRLIIHTPAQTGLEGWGSGVIGWFVASGDMRYTLEDLGMPASTFVSANQESPVNAFWLLAFVGLVLVIGIGRRYIALNKV